MVDCSQLIEKASGLTDTSAGLLPACIQAQATIGASQFSGWMTVLAGVFALIAGVLAFAAAYVGAKIQVEVTKKSYEAKVSSYRFRMEHLATRLVSSLHQDKELISRPHAGATRLFRLEQSQPGRTSIPDEFSPARWEEHSMLGQECVIAIVAAYEDATEYNKLKGVLVGRQQQGGQDPAQLAEELDDLLVSSTKAEATFMQFITTINKAELAVTPYETALTVISNSVAKILTQGIPIVGKFFG